MEEKNFDLDIDKRIITDIKVVNTKIVNQNKLFNSEYILYIFKIISPFNSWYISKRYSEIKEIFDFLVSNNPKLSFPSFPPKRMFSTKESIIIERKNSFEEIFFFIISSIEILKYQKILDFFQFKQTLLLIYIKNCILVNENRLNYELVDRCNSSSSSNDQSSTESNKDKKSNQIIKIKMNTKNANNMSDEKRNTKKENNTKDMNNINEINNDNDNEDINDNVEKNMNLNNKKVFSLNSNYFKCYEEYRLACGNYKSRSQVSFFIIKEFLRNLKVYSSHIFEIINDFTDYIKLKNKWKKFNEKEINALFIGINKDELFEDYYQSIFKEDKAINNYSTSSLSEKSTLTSTQNSISDITNLSNNISSMTKENKEVIDEENNNNIKSNSYLNGLLYNIGKFEENYLGARSCLLLLNKIFERDFNPEVDVYIKLFKKIDIKFIKQMNLYKFSSINNCINQKLCFNILNIYVGGYSEQKQIKILTELNANNSFITKFLESNYIDDNPYNIYC
jgi:hypothetical protein